MRRLFCDRQAVQSTFLPKATHRRMPVVPSFVPTLRAIGDATKADAEELAANPRARSAVLRVAEKLEGLA